VSSNTPSSNQVIQFLLPSVTDLIFVLLLVSLTYGRLGPRLLADADVGWHIRNGENILATHVIPRTNSFSATLAGQTWYSWEWLYDALLGWVHGHLGLNGVVLISALIIAFTMAAVFRMTLRKGGSLPVTIVVFLVCLVASSIHFLARPHIVSWLLAVFWFWALDRYERERSAGMVWFFPSLMMLWVNLHGGFVLGFVLLGFYLIAAVVDLLSRDTVIRSGARERAITIGLVLVGCGVASLINPYSYKLHVHVYEYLTNRFYMQHIDEFRAPNLGGLPAQAFVLLLITAAFGIWMARGKLRTSEWLIVAFSVYSGLWAARNIPIASMLLVMVTVPLISKSDWTLRRFAALARPQLDRLELNLRGHLWPVMVVVATLAICLNGGRVLNKQVIAAHFEPSRFPVRAVSVLAERGSTNPIFSLDSWGGYLIYTRYPEQRVFVDDRHDFYGEPYLRDYLRVLHVEPGWQEILDRWGVNLVVFPAKSKFSGALVRAGWKTMYQDETAAIFVRP